jgi:hypothetical protein
MRHARETELRGGIEFLFIKPVEESGRGCPIKTAVVKTQPDAGHVVSMAPFRFFPALSGRGQSLLGWRDMKKKSSGNNG